MIKSGDYNFDRNCSYSSARVRRGLRECQGPDSAHDRALGEAIQLRAGPATPLGHPGQEQGPVAPAQPYLDIWM